MAKQRCRMLHLPRRMGRIATMQDYVLLYPYSQGISVPGPAEASSAWPRQACLAAVHTAAVTRIKDADGDRRDLVLC